MRCDQKQNRLQLISFGIQGYQVSSPILKHQPNPHSQISTMTTNFNLTLQKQDIADIFQVSINSQKLIQILKQLEDNQKKIQKKIDRIDDIYKQGDSVLNRKIMAAESTTRNMIKEELEQSKVRMYLELRGYEEKNIRQHLQKQQKIKELKYSLQTLNEKINKVNLNLAEEIQTTVRNYSSQIFALRRAFQQSEEIVQEAIEEVPQKIQTSKASIEINRENIFEMEIKLKKNMELSNRPSEFGYIPFLDKKFQDSINNEKYAELVKKQALQKGIIQSGVNDMSKSRKLLSKKSVLRSTGTMKKNRAYNNSRGEQKSNNQNYMSTLRYASISAKVQSLQKKLQQTNEKTSEYKPRNDQRQSIFKMGVKNNMMRTFSYSKGASMGQKYVIEQNSFEKMQDFQILTNILNKLQTIDKTMEAKQKSLRKMVQQIKEKQIINYEKIENLKNKLNKTTSQMSQFKIKLLGIDTKIGQEHQALAISNIEAKIGKIIQKIDKESQEKLNIEKYNQDKNKINKKITVLQQNFVYKAQKEDVKKAIHFLEDKIKQIILVMANEYNQQKLGAINKMPTKCLTCDREVLKLQNITNMTSTTGFKGLNSSKSSRQLGQKYFTRLLKGKKQPHNTNRARMNYTSATQVIEQKQQLVSFS